MDYPQQLAVIYSETKRPDIKAKVVENFTKLVYSRAHIYTNKHNFEELVAAGFVGLLRALEAYEPKQGNKFVTLATDYVNGYILHYLRDVKSCIKNPTCVDSDASLYIKLVEKTGQNVKDEINLYALSTQLNVPLSKLQKCQKAFMMRTSTIDFTSLETTNRVLGSDHTEDAHMSNPCMWSDLLGNSWNDSILDNDERIIMTQAMDLHKKGRTSQSIARQLELSEELVRRCIELCTKHSSFV